MRQVSEDEAKFNVVAQSVLRAGLTVALTLSAIYMARGLIKAALWPGLGWYRWVLVPAELAFVAMLVWLWSRLIRDFAQRLKHRDKG